MTAESVRALAPFAIAAATAVASLLLIAVRRAHAPVAAVSFAGLAAAFLAAMRGGAGTPAPAGGGFLLVDGFSRWYLGIVFAASCATVLIAYDWFERRGEGREEFYPLLVLGALGAAALASSRHFATLFLGLELLSVSLYALISFSREERASVEAGVKYLVLAAVSSALLLFGMGLIYLACGDLSFHRGAEIFARSRGAFSAPIAAGAALIAAGAGFKLALVPFHMWAPDIYEGAPPPAAAFAAGVSKTAAFALLLRLFSGDGLRAGGGPCEAVAALAVASMLAGTFLALREERVARILAYSSIAQMGFMLVALRAAGPRGMTAAGFYLAVYCAAIVGAFGVVAARGGRCDDRLGEYAQLGWRRPWLGAAFAASLLSLAGMPFTAGFTAKFGLFAAGIGAGLVLPVAVLAATSAIGLYYYARLVLVIYAAPSGGRKEGEARVTGAGAVALAALTAATLWLGVWPGPLIRLAYAMVGGFR